MASGFFSGFFVTSTKKEAQQKPAHEVCEVCWQRAMYEYEYCTMSMDDGCLPRRRVCLFLSQAGAALGPLRKPLLRGHEGIMKAGCRGAPGLSPVPLAFLTSAESGS